MIFTYGIPRSGSTLIWRIANYIYNGEVFKTHDFKYDKVKYIISIRHPYDIVISLLNCGACGDIHSAMNHFKRAYSEYERYLKSDHDYIILKYEDFYNNHLYAIEQISKFLNISEVDPNILDKISLDSALKISDRLKKFSKYDKETLIHGNHINGVVHDQWKNYPNYDFTYIKEYVKMMGYND